MSESLKRWFLYKTEFLFVCIFVLCIKACSKKLQLSGAKAWYFYMLCWIIYRILNSPELQSFIHTFFPKFVLKFYFKKSLPQPYVLTTIKYCLGRGRKSITIHFKLKCIQLLLHFNDCIWQRGTIKLKPDNYQTVFSVFLLLKLCFTGIQWYSLFTIS